MKCDIEGCEEEGDNPLTAYINLCGLHWFRIMNKTMFLPDYLEDLHNKRKEVSESPAEDKDYGIIECSDKICEEMLNDCRKELIAEIIEDLHTITKDYYEDIKTGKKVYRIMVAKEKIEKWEARKNK